MAFVAAAAPFLAKALPFISAGFGLVGNLFQGREAGQAAAYQSAVVRNNAAVARKNAEAEAFRTQQQSFDQDQAAAAFIGDQTAAQGASGLSLSSPSNVAARQTTRRLAAIDRQNIGIAGQNTVNSLLQQESDFLSQARQIEAEGASAGTRSLFAGLGGAASSLADSFVSSGNRRTATRIPTPTPRPRFG